MKKQNFISLTIRFIILFFISISIAACSNIPKDLQSSLQKLSDLPVVPIEADSIYKESYEMFFTQALDHENKNSETFTQKVYVNHIGYDKPTVVVLEGYNCKKDYASELSKLLIANQIIIEHRFFGDSRPDSIPWDFLTIKQAATDQHLIIQALKKIYPGKWISTGISKGGQTTIFQRRFFPNDVNASVPYVAPLNLAREDPRINEHFRTVGTKKNRDKIISFQKLLFERKDKILPLVKKYADENKLDFNYIGIKRAYDLNILEFSFSFWQWSGKCELIPDKNASINELFNYWKSISPFSFFAIDSTWTDQTFTFQALYEEGFYNYDISEFRKYLLDTMPITFDFKLKDNMKRKFRPEAMQDINMWVQNEGNNMLYIYGENDPWGSTAANPSYKTNSVKMINPNGNHRTRIKSFPQEMKDSIYTILEDWTGVKIIKRKNTGGISSGDILEIL